jgi:hypothetical protein
MKLPKSITEKQEKKGALASFLRFLKRHGEKIAAGVVFVVAVSLALQTRYYQPLSWQPDELTELANDTENTIKEGVRAVADEEIKIFDYAMYAEQIKEQIPLEPYRSDVAWNPVLHPGPQPRSGFDILTAESLRAEAARLTGLTAQGTVPDRWQRPPLAESQDTANGASIWVNLYGTIPVEKQRDIYNQVFSYTTEANSLKYVYYEWERAEIKPNEELIWQPVVVYPDNAVQANQPGQEVEVLSDFFPARLIPLKQPQETLQEPDLLLFSDFDVKPAAAYIYRIRLYLVNPNYNLQETSVAAGVDTTSEYIRSDWSHVAHVYVPDRTLVQLQSVTPTDTADFPRQAAPLRPVKGTLFLDYFDIDLGQSLPLVEKAEVVRGTLCNMTKTDANKYINKGRPPYEVVNVNYPDGGLRSDVCVMDFSGGRKLQKRPTQAAQTSPDLLVAGKALLLMPDGTMHVLTTEPKSLR